MILVIGGGLAGLSAALSVQESGQQVHLIEANEQVGGRVTSERIDGFTLDRGFQVINPGYREFERLNLRTLIHPIPAGAAAMVNGQWRFFGDPRREMRTLGAALPIMVREVGSFAALIQAALLKKVSPGESSAEFLTRVGIKGQVYSSLVEPFLRGVFLEDLAAVDGRFAQRVLRSLYRRVPGLPDGGVLSVALELRNRLKSFQSGSRVHEISRAGKGFTVKTDIGTLSARKVIVATDYDAARIFSSHLPDIKQTTSFAWHFTIDAPLARQHQLHVSTRSAGPVVTAIDVAASVPSYSPDGRGLLSVTTLLPTTESEVRRHLTEIYGEPLSGELITQWEIKNALPLLQPGDTRTGFLDDDGLIFAGDYLSEPSQNGALLSGRLAGERAIL